MTDSALKMPRRAGNTAEARKNNQQKTPGYIIPLQRQRNATGESAGSASPEVGHNLGVEDCV